MTPLETTTTPGIDLTVTRIRRGGIVIHCRKHVKYNRFNKKGWVPQAYAITELTSFSNGTFVFRAEQVRFLEDGSCVWGGKGVWLTPNSYQLKYITDMEVRTW